MRTLYLGWVSDSSKPVSGLQDADIEPVVVNTERNFRYRQVPGVIAPPQVACDLYKDFSLPAHRISRFGFALSPLFRRLGKSLSRRLAETVEQHAPIDFVFAHWGAGILPEMMLLKKHRATKHLPENPKSVDDPQAVYMGQLDFHRRLNDVSAHILALAQNGLPMHCVQSDGLQHPNVRFFPHMPAETLPSGELFGFVRQFRACLATYNLQATPPLRYRISLPSRFLAPLAAGVPVLLPKGHFPAMERSVA